MLEVTTRDGSSTAGINTLAGKDRPRIPHGRGTPDEYPDPDRRHAGGGKAPASNPEAWLIAPARIDALLVGQAHMRAAFVSCRG